MRNRKGWDIYIVEIYMGTHWRKWQRILYMFILYMFIYMYKYMEPWNRGKSLLTLSLTVTVSLYGQFGAGVWFVVEASRLVADGRG